MEKVCTGEVWLSRKKCGAFGFASLRFVAGLNGFSGRFPVFLLPALFFL